MKQILLIAAIASTNFLFGQEICIVSADYQSGESIIVMWEWPPSTAGIDSVFVYRKSQGENSFSKIGGKAVGELSAFNDLTANTKKWNAYRISYKYSTGTESAPSPWHKPLLLDYGSLAGATAPGQIEWTEYLIEGQTSSTFVLGYKCYADPTGLGNFVLMNTWTSATVSWFDQDHNLNPNTQYVIEVQLPNCNVNKANINTSRSNIKKQVPNAEAGIETISAQILSISPNPVEDKLTIGDITQMESLTIVDCNGKNVFSSTSNQLSSEINLSHLKSGIYFIEAIDFNGVRFTNKIVKQ
jgi:Secretion system C-terminal sorting domain